MNNNSELTIINNEQNQVITSSRQVAESFGKLHKDVLESIRDILVAEISATTLFYEITYENRGKEYPEFIMNRDGFTLLAMGFTGKDALRWKMMYINAFNEMEKTLKESSPALPVIPQTLAGALRLAMEQAEEVERLSLVTKVQAKELNANRPKAEVYDVIVASKDALPMEEVAKLIGLKGMGRNNLFKFLTDNKILKRTYDGDYLPAQKDINNGYFRVITNTYEVGFDTHIKTQTLVYPKGITAIIRLLNSKGHKVHG